MYRILSLLFAGALLINELINEIIRCFFNLLGTPNRPPNIKCMVSAFLGPVCRKRDRLAYIKAVRQTRGLEGFLYKTAKIFEPSLKIEIKEQLKPIAVDGLTK